VRSMNYQLNGYPRDTNPFTMPFAEQSDLVSFKSVSSCGTATAISVPCMFSRMSQADFDGRSVKYQDGLIDIYRHAGFNIIWLENDGGCKGVCDRVETHTFTASTDSPYCVHEFCYDQILVDEFDTAVERVKGGNAVIGLHLNGSHGPTYFERYPQAFRHFLPDCQRSDIQNCSNEEIVNTYDNTIRYTDYVLSEVIKKTQALSAVWDVTVVYVSDHGESLGENGIYLHGMPYALAPVEQTQVPMIFWVSDDLANSQSLDKACLKQRAHEGRYSHDNLFDTLLGLMSVTTSVYRSELDILAGCRG